MKKITMKRPSNDAIDAFVSGTSAAPAPAASEDTKRLTLDIPKSLHKAYKAACAERELSMVEDITHYIRSRCESFRT